MNGPRTRQALPFAHRTGARFWHGVPPLGGGMRVVPAVRKIIRPSRSKDVPPPEGGTPCVRGGRRSDLTSRQRSGFDSQGLVVAIQGLAKTLEPVADGALVEVGERQGIVGGDGLVVALEGFLDPIQFFQRHAPFYVGL